MTDETDAGAPRSPAERADAPSTADRRPDGDTPGRYGTTTGTGDASSEDASAIRAIQRASIERALVDGAAARAHLALAGALEAARTGPNDPPLPGLVPLAIVAGLDLADRPADGSVADGSRAAGPQGSPTGPPSTGWLPGARDDGRRLRVDGAAVAVRRFDVSVGRAAALAAVPVAELRAALDDRPPVSNTAAGDDTVRE